MMYDLDNIGVAVGISLVSRIQVGIYVIPHSLLVQAAIFDVSHRHTAVFRTVQSCCLIFIAVGISLLSRIQAEINVIPYSSPVTGRMFDILVILT